MYPRTVVGSNQTTTRARCPGVDSDDLVRWNPRMHRRPARQAVSHLWHLDRHDFAAVPSVDAKVGIRGEKDRVGERFGHAHEASVGETHGNVHMLLHELQYLAQVAFQIKGWDNGAAMEECGKPTAANLAEKVERLRQNSLTRFPGWREARCLASRPAMVTVAAAQQRDGEVRHAGASDLGEGS